MNSIRTSFRDHLIPDVRTATATGTLFFLFLLTAGLFSGCDGTSEPIPDTPYVTTRAGGNGFALATGGAVATLYIDADADAGVVRALRDFQDDLKAVSGAEPELALGTLPENGPAVLVGTLGSSPLIDRLVEEGSLKVDDIEGAWEAFVVQTVTDPTPDLGEALIVAGSDKRGTIYGIYDLSEEIGVSPWSWWADVPKPSRPELFVRPGRHTEGPPAVKYRGIFLNDENPALLGWVNETFGGFNHDFYEHVFELILRMKGNYLWPAMWGKAFSDDDPMNPVMADEYGIVMGTSHHEPLTRAQAEWQRYGSGPWDYEKNADTLRAFWRKGIERMDDRENIVTVGMRGDGDMPMTQGTAIELLERIVHDQRQILADVTGKDPATIPQMWALYKEVQDYYDQGMQVPDDITLLFSDDNWGNIRRLPDLNAPPRPGGYGIYYHYDYVGGPRNYKWINTNQIERVWEQMHLAYEYGADRIWIVNVGDLKPMEFPIDFFLDYAWNPEAWPLERLDRYTDEWVHEQFGDDNVSEIARMLDSYTKYNSRRKPELLSPDTYSLTDFNEADRVVHEYNALAADARRMYDALDPAYRDAFYQLVLFPIEASANMNELYVTVGKNRLFAAQKRAVANNMAEKARELFARDAELTRGYHEDLAGGKWNHMMSQTHIGYFWWQEPPENRMPNVEEVQPEPGMAMGLAIEGSGSWWPLDTAAAVLPVFDPYRDETRYVDIYNRGTEPFDFTADTDVDWLTLSPPEGTVDGQTRVEIGVDWDRAPNGSESAIVTFTGSDGTSVDVGVVVFNPETPSPETVEGFVEAGGYVSMEAAHFSGKVDTGGITWKTIPNLGRTLDSVAPYPVASEPLAPGGNAPHLEYRVYLFTTGDLTVRTYVSPTLNFNATDGLRYAVSIDDGDPVIVNIHEGENNRMWEEWVRNNVIKSSATVHVDEPGEHVLKYWVVDPAVVLQKLIIETDNDVPPAYLGPPESFRREEQ